MRLALRAKFSRRERHGLENTARIVVLARDAFLIGNRIFGCTDQILTGAYDAYHREKTDRNGKIFSTAITVVQNPIDTRCHVIRNIARSATAATAITTRFQNANTENNGLDYVDNSCRGIFGTEARTRLGAIIARRVIVASKGLDLVVTAKQNHTLFQHRNAVKLLRMTADAGLKGQLDKEFNVNGIKTAVKSDGIDTDIGRQKLGMTDTNRRGVVDDLITEIGQKDSDVLKAITIAAGIQDSVGFYTNQISARLIVKTARKSVFRHRFLLHKVEYGEWL